MRIKSLIFLTIFLCTRLAFAAQSKEEIVDTAMLDLWMDMEAQTNPELIADILQNDMFMSDMPGIKERLGSMLQEPQPVADVLGPMREAILSKHPAIVKFLHEANKNEWLADTEEEPMERMVHHMYILERLVSEMARDYVFMEQVFNFIKAKEIELGASVLNSSEGVFGLFKKATIDYVMKGYIKVRNKNSISCSDKLQRKLSLKANIAEAMSSEFIADFYDNSTAAVFLLDKGPDTVRLSEDGTRRIQYVYDQDWTSLYETWNLAFVIGNLDCPNLLLPKLLIPSVIGADSNDYLFNRVIALWLSIYFHLFSEHAGNEATEIQDAQIMASVWGKINLKYARELNK